MAEVLEKLSPEQLDKRERELLLSLKTPVDPNISRLGPSGLELREQELIRSLRKDGIETPIDPPPPVFDEEPSDVIQRDKDVLKLAEIPEFSIADPSDISLHLLKLKEDLKARFGTAEPIGIVEALANTRVQEKLPFIGSLYKFNRIADVFEAARNLTLPPDEKVWDILTPELHFVPSSRFIPKVQAKQRRQNDLAIVEKWLIELEERQARGITIGGRIAEGVTELPAFMVEFLATGLIFRIGSTAAKTAATKLLGRFAEKGASKLAIKVAATGFGTLLRTSVNVPRIMAGAVENMTEGIQVTDDGAIVFADADINPFSALARSFADLYIENLTEIAGPSLKKGVISVGTGIGKKFPMIPKFTQAIAEKWISNGAAKGLTRTFAGFLKASATKVGYDGILEEMGEEQLGRIIRGVTGLEDFETIIPKWEDILVEAGIFTIPGVTISLAQTKIFRKDLPTEPIERRLGLVGKELEVPPTEAIVVPEKPVAGRKAEIAPTVPLSELTAEIKEAWNEFIETRPLIGREHKQRRAAAEKRIKEARAKLSAELPPRGIEPWQMTKRQFEAQAISDRSVFANIEAMRGTLAEDIGIEHIPTVPEIEATTHRREIEKALKEGKPVPAEVLADYPDLAQPVAPITKAEVVEVATTLKELAEQIVDKKITGNRDQIVANWVSEKFKDKGLSEAAIDKKIDSAIRNFGTTLQSVERERLRLAQPTKVEAKVVKTTVETKTNAIQANVKEASVEPAGTVDAIRRNVLRAEDAVGFWGTAGKKVQRDLREISARTAINVGNTSQNIRAILKGLNSKEKVTVAQLTDKAISKKGQPARLVERARQLTVELDLMQIEAQDVGLRKGELTGKAFPQVPNKMGKEFLEEAEVKGAKSHKVFAWAQNKVTEGKFKTVDSAIAALQNYRRTRLRGTEGYFEGKRTLELDLDMREWSPDKILSGIIEGGWEAIEGARQWGVTKDGNFKDIRTSIERIRGEIGNDQANLLEDYIKAQYGQSRASVTARKWSAKARAFQFTTKLAPSMLTITRNMFDRFAKGFTHGTIGANIRATLKFPPFLNKWMKTSQKIQDEMIRRGAVLGHGHLSEGFASGGKISRFIGQPFAQSERGNQTYIALVKKLQLEADIKRLHEMGGETGTIGKMYDRMLTIVGQSQLQTRKRVLTDLTNEQLAKAMTKKEIDDDVMSEVLHRVVTDSAFPLTLASKRMWWGNRPFVQTMTQFKVWSADQMRFIYKDVLKYTIATGDPSRLARFILGTWMAGELYNIIRDILTNKDESLLFTLLDPDGRNVKEISKSVANSIVDGGIIGMLADLTYGITDWAFGPTVGSIESIAARGFAAAIDPATTVDGLKMFVLEDIPAAKQAQGVLDRIDRTFFNKEENLTANYAKWRKRSFDFRKKKGELTEIERLAGRILFSRTKRLPGPRTLSFEMIARQVLVGDTDDAAGYIVGIIKDTKPEKLKDLRASFRQSAVNNSPLGNIAKKDISEFLGQFSKEGQAEIVALQNQWNKNYNEAVTLASKQLKEDRFFEELREELSK